MNLTKLTMVLKITKVEHSCLMTKKPLGICVYGNGNNKEDGTEGVHYKKMSMAATSTDLSSHVMPTLLIA